MSKKTDKKVDSQSFWTTVPGILTAIAAVITATAGLVAALGTAGLFSSAAAQPSPTIANPVPKAVTTASAQTSSVPTSLSSATTGLVGCFGQYFQGMAKDRVAFLESGSQDFQVISPSQTKDEPIGIIFTDNGQPVGGIKVRFFTNGQLFKVDTVVDSNCNRIEEYSNITGGGDKNVLQNWNVMQMRLGTADYLMEFKYDGRITADFAKSSR